MTVHDHRARREVADDVLRGVFARILASSVPVTAKELTLAMGLQRSTISRAVVTLIETDYVTRVPKSEGRAGRPVEYLQISDRPLVAGLSLSDRLDARPAAHSPDEGPGKDAQVSTLTARLYHLNGRPVDPDGPDVVEMITLGEIRDGSFGDAITKVLERALQSLGGDRKRDLLGVGLALGGRVHGDLVESCNLAFTGPVNVNSLKGDDWLVSVLNDANALSELAQPRDETSDADGASTLTVLIRDDGIGAALRLDGKIFEGSRGAAGELGHIKVPEAAGLSCRCDAQPESGGCLEALAAPNRLIERLGSAGALDTTKDNLEGVAFMRDEDQHFPSVRAAFVQAAEVTGRSIRNMSTLFDPSLVTVFLPEALFKAGSETVGEAYRMTLHRAIQASGFPGPPTVDLRDSGSIDSLISAGAAQWVVSDFLSRLKRREEEAGLRS